MPNIQRKERMLKAEKRNFKSLIKAMYWLLSVTGDKIPNPLNFVEEKFILAHSFTEFCGMTDWLPGRNSMTKEPGRGKLHKPWQPKSRMRREDPGTRTYRFWSHVY